MGKRLGTTVLFLVALALSASSSSYAQNCSDHVFSNGARFAVCNRLPVLDSFLHWTYHRENHTADIAYRHSNVTASNWVAWALNIGGSGMRGAQCLVAIPNSNGSVRAYTTPISGYGTQLQQGDLSFRVSNLSAVFSNRETTIFATLFLPANRTQFNTVWQDGTVSGGTPSIHSTSGDNVKSTGTVDFATGQSAGGGGAGTTSVMRRRNVHGVLNAVSWGVLMPMGALIARHMKFLNPAWFYLHVGCQLTAYGVGVAGWGTGMKLGSDSKGITHTTHRNIGITLFALGTLQMLALLVRPKPGHKYRSYWNWYHRSVGLAVIALGIANVFKGFSALGGQKHWKTAYRVVIIVLAALAVLLEILKQIMDHNKKKKEETAAAANGGPYSAA